MTSLAPPPFPTPVFLSARRITGHVLTEIPHDEQAMTPPTLERRASVAGNILLLEDQGVTRAYSLQRKIKDSMHSSVRVGFELNLLPEVGPAMYEFVPDKPSDKPENDNNETQYKMVTVKVFSLHEESIEETTNEVAALQWVTSSGKESHHLQGPVLVGKDATHIYMITPYHKEESLFDYCGRVGRLSESKARCFFRQTLQGLEELKDLEICHRGLDLDSIHLKGATCIFSNFEHALRIPVFNGQSAFISSQEPHGKNPQSVAPELLKSEPFDGNAVDLWAAGVILFQMLLGCIALFDAPIAEDIKYEEICIRSDLKGALQRWMPDDSHPLSAELVDLLERMLKADPHKRLTLSGVQNHPWVMADNNGT
ncbi:hypothetical protein FisN_6Hh324 [Fistulifera solaris]|uniref:non-specific serine/threonine protein kinase n=1 Tax=Fistulifera solaris TaxID=1519565 RepID=A0A1Z5K776_FISSO|nr:hypothetical protein FisN_6Hh324 [Fistulifera solaris]|eukprot:GAX22076.1 hypothetical protein FisN_6Hh324 [Fistulifera solaris]